MKIQNDSPNVTPGAAESLARIADQTAAPEKGASSRGGGDQVTLSSDARMMQGIVQQATEAPAIRQDVVDRIRALLDKGELSVDPSSLADAIIDDWTTHS